MSSEWLHFLNTCRSNPKLSAGLRKSLAKIAGAGNFFTDPGDCWPYGYDNSRRHVLPQAVVFARYEDQIANLIRLCQQAVIPLTARGRGTGTTGATVPTPGGIVLSFERMARILRVDPADRLAIVEPGVINLNLQQVIAKYGFFWPPDPSSSAFCTIGGNLAYNSAGPRAVKYGTPRENTLGLRAINGQGELFKTGVLTTKGVIGYDLTRLLIGSEGTLALITAATLKLTPLPEAKGTIHAAYRDIHAAAAAVANIMAQAITPCALEFIDAAALAAVQKYTEITLPQDSGALLLIEVDGSANNLNEMLDILSQAARNDGLLELKHATDPAEVKLLWKARQALSPALRQIAPHKINEDVVVPVSQMGKFIAELTQLGQAMEMKIVNFGHAGNGNIHVNLLLDFADPQEIARADLCLDKIFALVLNLGGTLSGEHGVGLTKRDFIARELDPVALKLMAAIKQSFDPTGILNPDKALPPEFFKYHKKRK